MKKSFAEIVFPLPIDHAFTYRVPENLRGDIRCGHRVLAPFGNRRITGFVVGLKDKCDLTDVRDIEDLLDPHPVFSQGMLKLTRWVADYYLCSWGEALGAALPAGTKLKSKGFARLSVSNPEELLSELEKLSPKQAQIIKILSRRGEVNFDHLKKRVGASGFYFNLHRLVKKGYVQIEHLLPKPKVSIKYENFVRLKKPVDNINEFRKKAPKQARCLELLISKPEGLSQPDLLKITGAKSSSLKSLQAKGLIEVFQKEVVRDYYEGMVVEEPKPIILTEHQRRALEAIKGAIKRGRFRTFLLHGVTGSGKTQVYIEAIAEVLKRGKQAIVLVPEISLTPQMVSRFKSYFHDQVAVLHSKMSEGERYDSWRKTLEGRFNIVIGPRSAVFAPLQNLGLIVIDEEQEATYKQFDPSPRYNARDVAVMRAKLNEAVAILGSATPSMESYYNARKGKYHLLVLPKRIEDIPMPRVEVINMSQEWKRGSLVFSQRLLARVREKLRDREQVILLQNRRGFSTCIICQECGYVERCPSCEITLTYHLKDYKLRCHYCGFKKDAPQVCPRCGGVDIKYTGVGTQRVEQAIKRQLRGVRVIRMDLDTTSRKWAHDRILRAFSQRYYDVLLGTQMVAKGLDFPRVTLVGVISADTSLFLPDFRASERTFQLLTQVAGRAGRRDKVGEVIIQTFSPGNPALRYAQRHDFLGFYQEEIKQRRELLYPPFGRLINVTFRGEDEDKVRGASERFAALLDPQSPFYRILGPAPCPLVRIKGRYRWQIILKGDKKLDPSGVKLREEVKRARELYKNKYQTSDVILTIDVDPMEMM